MKTVTKRLVTLGLTALLALGSITTAFASECGATVYGQQPTEYADGWYFAIIVGNTEIQESDISLSSGATIEKLFWQYSGEPWGELPDLTQVNGQWAVPDTWNNMEDGTYKTTQIEIKLDVNTRHYIDLVKLPSNVSAADLGEYAKYVINANGSTTPTQPTEKTATWASDSKGWWIQYSDGTYLTNNWYQSPESGLYYYMGADGYMLTNTITPDGYTVNAEGVWVQ